MPVRFWVFQNEHNGELTLVADDLDVYQLKAKLPELQQIYNQKTAQAIEDRILVTASRLNKGNPIINRTETNGRIQIAIAYPKDIQQHQQQNLRR